MLTQNEILNEVFTLPISEQREIADKIEENIQQKNSKTVSVEEKHSAYLRLRGIAAVEGKVPPTDEEVKEDFMNYLSEKHR